MARKTSMTRISSGARSAEFAPVSLGQIPTGCILGLSYSGMHDTAVAIVGPDGAPLWALSLERLTRVKQDGRWPTRLLDEVPWDRIEQVALSVSEAVPARPPVISIAHPLPLATARQPELGHGDAFRHALAQVPKPIVHVPHHTAHAASAYWGSGFDEATCLVYDGGMSNEDVFGGLWTADQRGGLLERDRFCSATQANVTQLYTAVTAMLGFTPQKHEGKVTGLAAYGQPVEACRSLMLEALADGAELEGLFHWRDLYGESTVPELQADPVRIELLRHRLAGFSREDIAACVQAIAEEHVVELVRRARAAGLPTATLCLSGGLFANVKVNQRVAESGCERFYVSPAMTDDGTALGAAWVVHAARAPGFRLAQAPHMYLGPGHDPQASRRALVEAGIAFDEPAAPALAIAERLAAGQVVAVFQGRTEFGPRALCNRSILAPAAERGINDTLNHQLSRTEFMPFAPVVRDDDAAACFDMGPPVRLAADAMTVTVGCTESLTRLCPGIVHVDGTARPQFVTAASNPLAYEVLTHYQALTGRPALVNTSFNVHEEPIVCSLDDALRGFFEAGLDHLWVEGAGLIDRRANAAAEIRFLREKVASQAMRLRSLTGRFGTRTTAAASTAALYADGKAMAPYLAEGFHAPEPWGAWTSGRHARLVVPLPQDVARGAELHVTMSVRIFEGLLGESPVLAVRVDGRTVGYVMFRVHGPLQHELSFFSPAAGRTCEIAFELSHADSPRRLAPDVTRDGRQLGMCLGRLSVAVSAAGTRTDEGRAVQFWGA